MSVSVSRGLTLFLAVFCGVVILTAAISQAAGPAPDLAGLETATPTLTPTATPTPIPCTDGQSNVPCRMVLTASGPGVVCEGDKCSVPVSGTFTLAVDMVSVPKMGYILAQSRVDFGSHLTYKPASQPTDEVVIEGCGLPVQAFRDGDTHVVHGCIVSVPPVNSFGDPATLAVFELTCSQGTTSTLVELLVGGGTESLFTAANGIQVFPDLTHVTVNCVVPDPNAPTPTYTDTPTLTPTPSHTPTPSETPTGTLTPATATPTPSVTPTGTLTPATATPTPSMTPTGTLTPATATPTPSETPTGTLTPPAPTDTPTSTSAPTSTPTRRPTLLGDVNCDGSVNPIDAVFLLQLEAGLIDELPCPEAGDANGDGETSLIDATVILQFTARLISSLPP